MTGGIENIHELGMQLIREALEGMFEPLTVSAVIFEALAGKDAGELPSSRESLLDFARSYVRWAIEARLGEQAGEDFVSQFEVMLERFSLTPIVDFEVTETKQLKLGDPGDPVPVLMLSANTVMGLALQGALGYQMATVETAEDLKRGESITGASRPKIVVIDGLMPIPAPIPDLLAFFANASFMPATRIIWGAEQGWGRELTQALEQNDIVHTPMDSREGVEPILDLVRVHCG